MSAYVHRTGPKQLIAVAGAAAYADVSIRTIRRWIAAGDLRAYRVGPRVVRVDLADLERLARPIRTAALADRRT